MLGECVRACEASTTADRATVLRVFRISVEEPEGGFAQKWFPRLSFPKIDASIPNPGAPVGGSIWESTLSFQECIPRLPKVLSSIASHALS